MSNIDCCKVCDKQKSLRECELCRTACCDRCYSSHKSENICKLIKAYKDQIDCMFVVGVNSVFPNFCVNCSKPIDEACCNTCHKISISIKDTMPELRADMKKERLWLKKKKSEGKKYVEALPEYSNENTAIRNKMKDMMKENKTNSLCLENLQHKLEHDLTTFEQQCDDIGDFRMQAGQILNEFSSLEKVKSLFIFLPIWLNIKRKIDNWKTTLRWTPFKFPGGIRFNYENHQVSNLEPYLEFLNGEKSCRDPDLPKHADELDKLTDSLTEVVKINDQLRKSPDKCEHLQHMLDVLYKLSFDSHKLSFKEETAILSQTFGGTDTDKMTEKAEQTAKKITELRRECIEKEDIIKELQRKRDEQQLKENEIQELKLKNQSLIKENEELGNDIQNLKREHKDSYESYKIALREQTEENMRLATAGQETYDIVKKLRDEREKTNLEIKNLKDEIKSLKLSNDGKELLSQKKLQEISMSMKQQIEDNAMEAHKLPATYYDKDQSLRSEVQSLKEQKDELEKNIKDSLKKIEEQKYTLYLENTELQNRPTKIDEERLKENEIQELKLLNESLRKQNKELEMQTKNMEQGNSEMEKSYRDKVQFLKSEVESLTKQNDELKQHANDNPQTFEEHKHTLYQESIEIENRPTENDKEQKIQELQLMNESITKKNKELEKDILHLKRENTELHNKQIFTDEVQCNENERLNSEIDLLRKRMAESEQQTRDIINGLTQDNKELKKRLEEQDINFCKIVVANEEINEQLREKERVCKESHDLYEKYQTNLKQLQEKNENEKRQLLSAIKQGNDALVFQKKEKEDLKYSYGARLGQLQQQLENEKQQFLSKIQESNDALSVLRKEKDDLQNRLSSIAGEKLTKGNPAITDLGDPNRPMKIGEKYGELYDNEWTDAIECTGDLKRLNTDLKSSEIEEIVIHHLYKILTQCYQECLKLSNDQLMNVFQMTQVDTSKVDTDKESLPGCKEVLEIRRQHADKFAKELYQNKMLADKIVSSDWQYPRKSEDLMRRLMETSFYEKCVNLCWSMAIQNPVMVLSEDLPPGTVYDKNVFKEFVQSGNKVQYVVWPALYLYKNGPLLFKGVVQACK